MHGRRMASWLLAAAVLAAGCGDDDSGSAGGDGDGGGDGSSATDARSDAERQADEETASAVVLTIDDLPPGWEAEPPEDDEQDAELEADLAACLDLDPTRLDDNDNPKAESATFTSPNDEEVAASVTMLASPEAAIEQLEVMKSDAAPGCYAEGVQASLTRAMLEGDDLPDDVELGEPTINRISFADLGDDSTALRLTIPLTARTVDIDVTFDVVLVRVGRVGISATFLSVLSPFDADEAARLTQLMVDRVPAT